MVLKLNTPTQTVELSLDFTVLKFIDFYITASFQIMDRRNRLNVYRCKIYFNILIIQRLNKHIIRNNILMKIVFLIRTNKSNQYFPRKNTINLNVNDFFLY